MNIYIYLLFLMRLGVGDWWYNSLGLVVIGVIYADFEKYINWLFDHFYYILLGVFISLFLFTHIYRKQIMNHVRIPFFLLQNITSTAFTLSLVAICKKVNLYNKITNFLGDISFEMYMFHPIIMSILVDYLKSDKVTFYFAFLLFAFTIEFSFLFNYIMKKIYKVLRI